VIGLLLLLAVMRLDPEIERELVERARISPTAFGELYDHYFPLIYAYTLRRVGDPTDAEDIAALTFEKAMRGLERFEWKDVSFSAWLYRIATNLITDHFRHAGRHKQVSFEALEGVMSVPECDIESIDQAARLMELVAKLPEQYRRMIALKFFEGLSLDEMVEVLGQNKKTVTMKLYRSLKALKKVVAESGMTMEEGF
jgi:RNA polymerase sigma-70 factor (ECF subfamily)